MVIQNAPYIFLSNTVSTKNVGIAPYIIVLLLLLAAILVCTLSAPPSLLTVTFKLYVFVIMSTALAKNQVPWL